MIDSDHEDNDTYEYSGPSKSQLKREMHALQGIGKRMMELSDEQLDTLTISDTLRHAIEESRRIRQNEAKRRHLQYIGKIIRQEDDPEAVQRAIDAFDSGSEEHTRRHHLAERWRDRMIAEGDAVAGEFFRYCPDADIQHLRNLVRNARRDVEKQKNTGQTRKLFRYLRERIDEVEA
ncbi:MULTISPECIES: ribosome biogenesis factor YjgA [unclassified Marinobacter]|uniref:ribosome biogenesis factor YjgA n=1 Tax=unclassified Marinobacter TaxID=83889 RepID=UPI0026E1690F|nr:MULTISPECIES: ribosome biogenesis factor YjgA [unclassified Marinobacter]MDO6443765.1 ribosome biogenesis factor YjgA [Marinobacter sp. 2_MG-2023]MDO6823245.1 ribosome biogenesis factor YjgA [Marinobacter sp. 1_MG-2023]